jgi:hypothetical protein
VVDGGGPEELLPPFIGFLIGQVSIQTTERYLGCKQKLRIAVNDHVGIEPAG